MSRKISLKSYLRKGLIATLVLLFLGSTGTAVWWFRQPAEKEEEVTVYTCQQEAAIDYRVYYLPNNYLTNESAGPGLAYITPLTNYINTSFTYQFAGESQAAVSGEYTVTAALTGYLTREKPGSKDEKELVKLFAKDMLLVPATAFQGTEQKLTIKNEVAIDFRHYVDFVTAMAQDLRVSPEIVQLSITFHVSSRVITENGEVLQELAPVMIIPVEGSTFMVQGQLTDKQDGTLTNTQMNAVPELITNSKGYAIAAVIFLFLLLIMIFKTTAEIKDPLEKELSRIMKKYGDWIAAGEGAIPAVAAEKTIVMQSFDDLIKVADELGQPVLYENTRSRIHNFFVISNILAYRYTLQNPNMDCADTVKRRLDF